MARPCASAPSPLPSLLHPVRGGRHEADDGQFEPAAGAGDRPLSRNPDHQASVRRFADEEIFVEILENVRGEDVFVVQSTSYPANDNLMELLICIDALQARLGQADHRRAALFRLCPAGPQARAAHADFGQAGRQSDHRRRRQPRALGRSPRRPDPGLLRHPDRQSLRRAGDVGGHPGALRAAAASPSSRPTSAASSAPARSPSGSTTRRSRSSTSAARSPANPR